MIQRLLQNKIITSINANRKITVVYGARQVGKTTLIQKVLKKLSYKTLVINADLLKYNAVFSSRDLNKMKEVIDDNELLFIDEAQSIPNIGINLKILHDNLPNLKIIVTGSSSFELANKIKEPLTGRTQTYYLYPISVGELRNSHSIFELKDQIPYYLQYGMYPEIIQMKSRTEKIKHLQELTSAYLYKDVLQLAAIKHSDKIYKLLQLLAFQIGNLVSMHEIGKTLQISHETVNHYIDLLEKGFIIYRLSGYSGNLRKEVTKMNKIYFFDLGIRNALIENFNSLEMRQDVGQLWENFIINERIKKNSYQDFFTNQYFWRTYSGAEIDYIESHSGILDAYEIKWNTKKHSVPKTWIETYKNATYKQIDKNNFLDFII